MCVNIYFLNYYFLFGHRVSQSLKITLDIGLKSEFLLRHIKNLPFIFRWYNICFFEETLIYYLCG